MDEIRGSIISQEDSLNLEIDFKLSETSQKQSITKDQHDSTIGYEASSTDRESSRHLKESPLTSKSLKEVRQRGKGREDKDTGNSSKPTKKRKCHYSRSRSRSRSQSRDRSHRKHKKHHHKSHSRKDNSMEEH